MFKGDWRLYAAFGIISAFLCVGYPISTYAHSQKAPSGADHRPKGKGNPTANTMAIADSIDRLANAVISTKTQNDSAANEQRAKAQLKAEQDSATWAFWGFIASGAGVLVSVAGLGLIYVSLEDGKKDSVSEFRSYIRINPPVIIIESNSQIIVNFDFENYGRTPAHIISTDMYIVIAEKGWMWGNYVPETLIQNKCLPQLHTLASLFQQSGNHR